MWFMPVPDGDETPVPLTSTLQVALGLTVLFTILSGTLLVGEISDITDFTLALG